MYTRKKRAYVIKAIQNFQQNPHQGYIFTCIWAPRQQFCFKGLTKYGTNKYGI